MREKVQLVAGLSYAEDDINCDGKKYFFVWREGPVSHYYILEDRGEKECFPAASLSSLSQPSHCFMTIS